MRLRNPRVHPAPRTPQQATQSQLPELPITSPSCSPSTFMRGSCASKLDLMGPVCSPSRIAVLLQGTCHVDCSSRNTSGNHLPCKYLGLASRVHTATKSNWANRNGTCRDTVTERDACRSTRKHETVLKHYMARDRNQRGGGAFCIVSGWELGSLDWI